LIAERSNFILHQLRFLPTANEVRLELAAVQIALAE
jgi:hypothetical protein